MVVYVGLIFSSAGSDYLIRRENSRQVARVSERRSKRLAASTVRCGRVPREYLPSTPYLTGHAADSNTSHIGRPRKPSSTRTSAL
jgi:hypothetical protein